MPTWDRLSRLTQRASRRPFTCPCTYRATIDEEVEVELKGVYDAHASAANGGLPAMTTEVFDDLPVLEVLAEDFPEGHPIQDAEVDVTIRTKTLSYTVRNVRQKDVGALLLDLMER